MGIVLAIALILCGILGAANLIIAKRPDAAAMIDKLTPIAGGLGVVSCLWGIWMLIQALMNLNVLHIIPVWYITWVAAALCLTLLGFLLGFGLISKYALSKNESAMARGNELQLKLAGIQGPLGLVSLGLGIWTLIATFIYHV